MSKNKESRARGETATEEQAKHQWDKLAAILMEMQKSQMEQMKMMSQFLVQ